MLANVFGINIPCLRIIKLILSRSQALAWERTVLEARASSGQAGACNSLWFPGWSLGTRKSGKLVYCPSRLETQTVTKFIDQIRQRRVGGFPPSRLGIRMLNPIKVCEFVLADSERGNQLVVAF